MASTSRITHNTINTQYVVNRKWNDFYNNNNKWTKERKKVEKQNTESNIVLLFQLLSKVFKHINGKYVPLRLQRKTITSSPLLWLQFDRHFFLFDFYFFLSFCNFILIDLSLIFSTSTTKLDKNTSFCTMKRTHMAHRDTEFENRSLQYGNCIIRDQSNDDTSALSDLIETDDKRASKKNAKQIIWKITKDEKTRRRRNRWF